jgi:plastocyanin
MNLRNGWVYGVGVFLAISVAACGGGGQEEAGTTAPPAASNAASGQRVDPATAGAVKGTVVIEGTPPPNAEIKMMTDPVCYRTSPGEQTQETYVVGSDGKSLANVFVYVKDGLGNYVFDVPTEPVVLDQRGCRYHPHVFGIRVGQPLEVLNSDSTLHNIHAMPDANAEFNFGQMIQGQKTLRTFTAPEVMVPFKCDVHGWMNAYAGVLDHPYFAVTTTDGAFDLESLPPGTYTIEAWHEKLGTATESVTIGEKETKEISFTFQASSASAD